MSAPEDRLWTRLLRVLPEKSGADELDESLRTDDLDAEAAWRSAAGERLSESEIESVIEHVRRCEGASGSVVPLNGGRRWRWLAAALFLAVIGIGGWLIVRSGTGHDLRPSHFEVALLQTAEARPAAYRAGQVIVQISEDADPVAFGERWRLRPISEAPIACAFLFERGERGSMEGLLAELRNDSDVLWAEPNYLVRTTVAPQSSLAVATGSPPSGASVDHRRVTIAWVGSPIEAAEGLRVHNAIREVSPDAEILWQPVVDDRGLGDVFQVVQGLHAAWTRGARVIQLGVATEAPSELLTQAVMDPIGAGLVVIAADSMFTRDVGTECPTTCGTLRDSLACDTGSPLVRTPGGSGADTAALAGAAALAFSLHPGSEPGQVAACLREQLQGPESCRRDPRDAPATLDVVALSVCPDM